MAKEKEKPTAPAADAAEVAAKSRETLEESGIAPIAVPGHVFGSDLVVTDVTEIPAVQTPAPVEQQHIAEKLKVAVEMRAAGWHSYYSRIHSSLVWKSPDQAVFEAQQENIPPDAAITHYNQGKKS
jgi:hypothetical protein